jgi:vancomycin resistance protein YoaR
MRLTIIPSDKYIAVDSDGILKIQQDLSWIPSNVHALQWYDTWGEVEYNDGTVNEKIEELGIFEQAVTDFNNEKKRIDNENAAIEAARDYWEELRILRNKRLSECDWTQVADVQLSDTQKTEWTLYRQQLRDLPENITDPKPLVLDANHSSWPVPHS